MDGLFVSIIYGLVLAFACGICKRPFWIRKGSIVHSKRGMERMAVRYNLRTILYVLSPGDNLIVFSQVHNLALFSLSSSGKCLH
jgi:hypothetical protein